MQNKTNIFILAVVTVSIAFSVSILASCKKNNSNSENAMPTAILSADTLRGDTTTIFHFDASASNDKEDTQTSLMVAWDFGENASGYTPYNTTKTIIHTFTFTGVYTVKLVVKDTQGLADTTSAQVVIVNNLSNLPPEKPVYTSPDNYANSLPTSFLFTWLCSDPENDPLTYDVYLGYDPSVLYRIATDITAKEYLITSMEKGTNYFWRITVRDPNGNVVEGDVWKFTTAP
jgi:PKD repeat protein